jgi:hypothetical protein
VCLPAAVGEVNRRRCEQSVRPSRAVGVPGTLEPLRARARSRSGRLWNEHEQALYPRTRRDHHTGPNTFLSDAAPGVYAVFDTVHGVVVETEVLPDGTRRTVKAEPMLLPGPMPGTYSQPMPIPADLFEPVELRLGEPLPRQVYGDPLPKEGNLLDVGVNGVRLLMFFTKPTPSEIDAVQGGHAQVRLLTRPRTIYLLFKLGTLSWCAGAFNVHRVPARARIVAPDPGEGYGWMCAVVMVDSTTRTVMAMRQFALTRKFSVAILSAYEAQRALKPDDAAHNAEVARLQRHSPDWLATEALIRFELGMSAS